MIQAEKVEWKTLGEVAEKIYSGGTPKTEKTEYWENGTIPWMSSGEVNLGTIFTTEKFITEIGLKNSNAKLVPKNSVVIALAGQGKTRGKVARTRIDLTTNQSLASLVFDDKKVNSDYIYYFLTTQYDKLRKISSGEGTRGGLNLQMISSYPVPIPSLETQQKIVKILDKMTELEAKLEAKLEAELSQRRRQYEYYRNALLDFDNRAGGVIAKLYPDCLKDVEWKTLGEVTLPTSNIRWRETEQTYRYIDLTSVDRETHSIGGTIEISAKNAPSRAQKLVEKNDVIFATTRPTQLRFALIDDEFSGEVASTGYCVLRAKSEEVSFGWLYHHLGSARFKNFLEENQSGSAYPAISDNKVKAYEIPIPPLEIQQKIVAILDQFDTLTQSISQGLPREIALRRKQYEYYREQLLNFAPAA